MLETQLEQARLSVERTLDKLVDDKLVKPEFFVPAQTPPSNIEPVQMRRPSWGKVRLDYENKQREAYWRQQVEKVDAADAERLKEAKEK